MQYYNSLKIKTKPTMCLLNYFLQKTFKYTKFTHYRKMNSSKFGDISQKNNQHFMWNGTEELHEC